MVSINGSELHKIMPYATLERCYLYAPILTRRMAKYDINTPLRVAHFLAQIAHESGSLKYTTEIASGVKYEGRTDLGNIHEGDGTKFKGRGLIQLTGRKNYTDYDNATRCGCVASPSLLSTPEMAVDVSCWFWKTRGLNELADKDDVKAVTRRVNGGYNGLEERTRFLATAKRVLGV